MRASPGIYMAVIKLRRRVKAHADVVWKVISDMSGLAQTAPHVARVEILSGEGKGLKRRLHDDSGRWWEEECVDWQENRSYTMRVNEGNFAFAFEKMEYTWGIKEYSDKVLVWMRFDYTPRYGVIGQILDRFQFKPRFQSLCDELIDSWVKVIHSREWVYKVTVDTILKKKGHDVYTVPPDISIKDVAKILRDKKMGSAVVTDSDGSIVGMVSERDIVRGLAETGADILEHPVSDIMTHKVIVCAPEDNMVLVMACMTDRRIRHLPVMNGDEIVGIISIGDVVKTRIAELETESETLKEFIAGRRWRELYRKIGPAASDYV